jgi:hypothetical protein
MILIEGSIKQHKTLNASPAPRTYVKSIPLEQIVTSSGQVYELKRNPDCIYTATQPRPDGISMDGEYTYRCKGVLKDGIFKAYEITRMN